MHHLNFVARSCRSLIAVFLLLCVQPTSAQKLDLTPFIHYTPDGLLDNVFDNEGKHYSLNEIAIRTGDGVPTAYATVPATCSSGYFQLYLQAGCGMEGSDATSVARLNVLCQVLQDISSFVTSPCATTGQKVNIWVKAGLSGGAGGVATPFYNVPYSPTMSGITDNTIWLTLNSGKDAFASVAAPLATSGGGASGTTFFHGSIAFNFSGSVSWHTDLTTPTPAGKHDLYTVALHEMLHAMGFNSLIDYNGNSVIGTDYPYFSRYDMHLRTNSGTPLLTTPTATTCGLYGHTINPALLPIASYISPGGTSACPLGYTSGSADHTVCASALKYYGSWPTNIPVYTPPCFEKGSSLSHFEDECYVPSTFPISPVGTATNNQYYVMSNAGGPGPYGPTNLQSMKRAPKPEERAVLCDLGYAVGTSYGSAAHLNNATYTGGACPGIPVVGINDGVTPTGAFTYTVAPGSFTVVDVNPAGTGMMSNDVGVAGGSFKCLEVVVGGGTVAPSSGSSITAALYYPGTATSGVVLLRYIPVSSTGVEGNITYVFVFVSTAGCVASTCNMVANGNFENVTAPAATANFYNVRCWGPHFGSPDLFRRGCTTSPAFCFPGASFFMPGQDVHPFDTATNNFFLGGVSGRNASLDYVSESFINRLASPIVPGTTYKVSAWMRHCENGGFQVLPTKVVFELTNLLTLPTSSYGLTGPAGYDPLCTFSVADTGWHYYSQEVTYSGPIGNTLLVYGAPWLMPSVPPYTAAHAEYILYDDITIVPVSALPTFNLPDTIPVCNNILLDTLVNIPGGQFSWETDSSGFVVASHDTFFNTSLAYNATVLDGHPGQTTVCYHYTSSTGCPQSICKNTYLVPGAAPPTIIFWPDTLCVGDFGNVSATPGGGTWMSSDTSIMTSDTTTGVVTGISPGLATLIYTAPSGCIATVIIDVESHPITGIMSLDVGDTATLSSLTLGGSWSSGNPSVATISAAGLVTGIAPGTAIITYTGVHGCDVTAVVTISSVPTTGIGSLSTRFSVLSVIPQPTRGTFMLSGTCTGTVAEAATTITITDLLGRTVLTDHASVHDNTLRKQIALPPDLANGTYLLKVGAGNGTQTIRVVLSK